MCGVVRDGDGERKSERKNERKNNLKKKSENE